MARSPSRWAHFSNQTRGTLSFQLLPGSRRTFRYAGVEGFNPRPGPGGEPDPAGRGVYFFDRSFDIHWARARRRRSWWPAVAIGIRDIAGTGVYGSEYIVANAPLSGARDQLAGGVTGPPGASGWGRLGERSPLAAPLRRPARARFRTGRHLQLRPVLFRGDAALFGGVEWQATDRLRLQVEYSPDLYTREVADDVMEIDSPVNFGATYQIGRNATIGAHYLYGTTFGLSFNLIIDPRTPAANSLLTPAHPTPWCRARCRASPYATDWTLQADGPAILARQPSRG